MMVIFFIIFFFFANPQVVSECSAVIRSRRQVVAMLAAVVFFFFACIMPFKVLTLAIVASPFDVMKIIDHETYFNLLYFCRCVGDEVAGWFFSVWKQIVGK